MTKREMLKMLRLMQRLQVATYGELDTNVHTLMGDDGHMIITMDAKLGGHYHYCMLSSDWSKDKNTENYQEFIDLINCYLH